MLNFFRNFELEKISFFLGFLTATVLWFVISKLRVWLPDIISNVNKYIKNYRSLQTSGLQNAIRNEAFSRAQKNHIAKDLFALNEILIEPELLVQPILFQEDESKYFESEISNLVPFTPDFPFISRNINVPRISITEAIQKNADLVICGASGSGKTVALAHLVSSLAIKNPNCGLSSSKIPFYLDIHDVDINSLSGLSIADLLIKTLGVRLPSITSQKLPNYINDCLQDNLSILIIDGMDDLHPKDFDKIVKFIKATKLAYSNLQIVLTASHLYLGELLQNNFAPLFLSSWSNDQISNFYSRWNNLWKKDITKNRTDEDPNSIILNWCSTNLRPLNPLEFTLFIWGALSGDLSGTMTIDYIQSFIKRFIPSKELAGIAGHFAEILLNSKSFTFQTPEDKNEIYARFFQSELVQVTANGKFKFIHSIFVAYLASLLSKENIQITLNDDDFRWSPYHNFLAILSAKTQEPGWISPLISEFSPYFPSNFLFISDWLKLSNQNLSWKNNYKKQLIKLIQDSKSKINMKIRAMAAMVLSFDSSLPAFIRQLLSQNNDQYKILALFAIGCANRDSSFTADLISLSQKSTSTIQKYVSIALSTIATENAIHELGRVLLDSDEKIKQLVAECLAFIPPTGHEILKEAITLEDIVVRRASIYGFIKINNLWANQTLRDMSIQDSQWVVRNSASQALEFIEGGNPNIPDKILTLSETPWLVELAGKENLGVATDQAISKSLLYALESENFRDKYKAVRTASQTTNKDIVTKLQKEAVNSTDDSLINLIYISLFFMANSKKF